MEKTNTNRWKKILKWSFIVLGLLIISLFAIPSLFNDVISNEIKKGINSNLSTELQFKDSNISFFNHFPSLTFSFEDVNLASAKPFEQDTLINAKELGFGVNVFKLIFSDKVVITETYLTDSNIYLIKDAFGRSNYDIYKTTDTTAVAKDTTASDLNLNLRRLKLENASIHYIDNDNGLTFSSNGLNYNGRGGIVDGKLELGSRLDINSVNITFNHTDYLSGKKIEAKAFTIYDTENLSVALDKNSISLNDLKVNFNGNLDVFDNGIAYNLHFKTEDGSLEKVMSALPPKYSDWSKAVTLKGDLDATFNLAGYSGTVPEASAVDKMEVDVTVANGTIKHDNAPQALEDLQLKFNGDITNDNINFKVDHLDFTLNNERTQGDLIINGTSDSLYVKSAIQSHLNLDILNETLNLPDLKFNGILVTDITTDGVYKPLSSKLPKTKGAFKLTSGLLQTSGHPEPIRDIELDALIENTGETYEASTLTINTLNFSFLGNQFTSTAFLKNFDQPEYDITSKGAIDFTALNDVIDLPLVITNGQLTADMHLKGQLNNAQAENANSGTLNLKNLAFTSEMLPYPVVISEGQFLFLNDKMAFTNLAVQHQSSHVLMDGYFRNYMDYALYSKGILTGDLQLKAPKIDITEFFPKEAQLTAQTDSISNSNTVENVVSGVMQIPKNVDLAIKVIIDTLDYNKLNITKLSGDLGIKDQGLFLKNSTLNMVDGSAKIEGFYQPTSTQEALFALNIDAKQLNIEKGYNSMALFKELAPAAAQASGIVSVTYELTGVLDDTMLPVMPSLKGEGILKVHDVKFDGYKLLGKVSEKSGFDALNDPKVSEITINSTVSNNVLAIEQFKFKVSPFRLRAEGQTSFDGDLSLKMRIGLPPLGLIGIPVVIEGTSDDFEVKLGKKSKDLSSEEPDDTSAVDAQLEDISKRKDSLRDSQSVNKINTLQNDINEIKSDSIN
ncbi:AsmA-like C-terminal region-containing protein [Winogradskyella rapida]|uniref:AsmA-like C-terminal region-containing protein n=1 Tax=Winogradskyella rapida TaxID=549701 RepID=A0ABW3KT52_9FLAO